MVHIAAFVSVVRMKDRRQKTAEAEGFWRMTANAKHERGERQ
ncbi:hypothetical protein GTCCBUS3UF5_21080 [Geobacillus thermoleovorans CCB_US3_UF5]|uniref:Uncharacterized protein n=3 Tax=Geobacillus TaxID=129337 RepID=A0A1Q5SQ94_9BACL|nr:hypothetical protein GTCCBUS3UF5_21080 [Geobacillus thermoleovorans CCB_US3_UF5]OKO90187.1 hypothetical protein BRO54_3120 [Geobacillus proteiniphilus]GAD13541.1 hypothetical protein GBL_1758 [Geobacillus kaustophilus GBlys]GAJ58825.1 hypothetical protein B23_2038 [Geobacillus thermoleovorans B23]